MDCRKFESQLEAFLTEKLPPASMQECSTHLESCSTCRELLDLATRKPIQDEPARTEELVQAVLEKTSGKSCSQAHELLPDYVDGALAASLRELLELHLENCQSCQQIHQTMRELKEALPALAQLDPGSSFTRECMQAFRRSQNQPFQSEASSNRIWRRLLIRPRLVWEAAYILTLLFFALFKLFALIPEPLKVEAVSTLQAKSTQVYISAASTIKENLSELSMSPAAMQDGWTRASSKRSKELISAITLMTVNTKQFFQSTSNVVIQFPHSIWKEMSGKFEKFLPKDRPEA